MTMKDRQGLQMIGFEGLLFSHKLSGIQLVSNPANDQINTGGMYEVTALGKSILPILSQKDKWGTAHSAHLRNITDSLR
jgi:hypothetical protein